MQMILHERLMVWHLRNQIISCRPLFATGFGSVAVGYRDIDHHEMDVVNVLL
jgi:hypothetical protein